MICPICNKEMQEGGIIAEGVSTMWLPIKQFRKKGIGNQLYTEGKKIGKKDLLLGRTYLSNAFYCENCSKVFGFFDVLNGSAK